MKFLKNDVEKPSGVGKLIHILTWPIRRFYIIFALIAIFYIVPMFFGVKANMVYEWYQDKASSGYEYVMSSSFVGKIQNFFAKDDTKIVEKKEATTSRPTQKKQFDGLVDMPKPRTLSAKRKSFDGSSVGNRAAIIDVVENEVRYEEIPTEGYDVEEVAVFMPEEYEVIVIDDNFSDTLDGSLAKNLRISQINNLGLKYLPTPREIVGYADIVNSNELKVDGVHILLYGVYSHPKTIEGTSAKAYLSDITQNKYVRCIIVAYTRQDVPTAVCFVGNDNLNMSLVKMGYSKNIALY